MTITEAIKVAAHVKKAREIAGVHTDVPYSQVQLVDALVAIFDVVGDRPVSKDDQTRTARQLAAATARLAKYEKT